MPRSFAASRLAPVLLLLLCACPTADDDDLRPGDDDDVTEEPTPPPLVINEFMAWNRAAVLDGTGSAADWVELYNAGDEAIDLEGWILSDQIDDPEAGQVLEALTIEAAGHLVLWADGDLDEGPDHLSFALAAEGEELALFDPEEELVDALSYGRQAADVATARTGDGAPDWTLVAGGTPGASNGGPAEVEQPDVWPGPGPACELVSDLGEPWFSEGDTVQLGLACTGELATGEAHLEPVVFPDDAVFDPGGPGLIWPTGPASGGRAELVFQVSSEAGEIPHAGTVVFWVADDPSEPDNVPVDPATYLEEWGLPVFHVFPEASLSQEYVGADIWFRGRLYEDAGIKIRGAASTGYPKNHFTVRFDAAELVVDEWGDHRDRIVLMTSFDDNSYVRQKLVYDQWQAIAAYWGVQRLTPRTFFSVVYLDGQYHGFYTAADHVDDEFMGLMGFPDDGNLYKSVNHDANFGPTLANGSPKTVLHAGYEKKEGLPENDFSDLDALVAFTSQADAQELVDGVTDWIDLQEFMDWFLLVQYSASGDSAGKNCYLYNDPGGTGFRYAPWDFNHSWGQDWRTYRVASDWNNTFEWHNRVFWAIQAVPETDEELWDRFAAMRDDGPYAEAWIRERVDEYYTLIQPSAERDWAMWGDLYYTYGGWAGARNQAGDWTDYEGEKQYLYTWLEERAELYRIDHPEDD